MPPPRSLGGVLRQLGPGLIISAVIVGSGELIVTPKLGAEAGFKLLWFIILGCLLKVFVQIELGRHAVLRGQTTLASLNTLPGPRAVVSWVLWLWLAMYLSLVFQVAGMVGGVARVFALGGMTLPINLLAVLIGGSCAVLLVVGRYKLVENLSTAFVALFTLATLIAVGLLQKTTYAVTGAQLASGFTLGLPDKLVTAFAAFGIIGVGASELIYYPYWCLEKGYAKNIGPDDGTAAWRENAKGWLKIMRLDAWVSFGLYTSTTLAFYLLGAAILYAKNVKVENSQMIETLSLMYREVFGEWSFWMFLVGAFAVLYSTIFGATASNARLAVDALDLFKIKRYRDSAERLRWLKYMCVALPVAFTTVFMLVGAPVSLVFIGAVGQGLMLPFLAGAAIYYHFTNPHRDLRAGRFSVVSLIIASTLMAALGLYQVISALRG
ncbi:Natural resistance-associated macrophage protein [Lacunisphaera limnophila]|uniref:Natural resistance-associated macrophage protein n=1 Tax=Lacunisphaera limnophila TaxID=1838286 RepID=A0A1D8ASD9_9BACT|nr:Nramp family divalent metal transporter [Lacunisphaera limnophila]AOS43808.1 Natural resistance-associated macrophage protein [Lacunisphaera limnophila]